VALVPIRRSGEDIGVTAWRKMSANIAAIATLI
jgi:hypothetical protein